MRSRERIEKTLGGGRAGGAQASPAFFLLPLPVLGERAGERGRLRPESKCVRFLRRVSGSALHRLHASLAPLPNPLPGVPVRGSSARVRVYQSSRRRRPLRG